MTLLWHGASKLCTFQLLTLLTALVDWMSFVNHDILGAEMLRSTVIATLAVCRPLSQSSEIDIHDILHEDIASIWQLGIVGQPTNLINACKCEFFTSDGS